MYRNFLILFLLFVTSSLISQDEEEEVTGFYFGPKLGLTVANQNWNGFGRRPLFDYHGILFIESLDPYYKGSLFAQVGYHSRGSSLIVNNITQGLNFSEGVVFRNLAVTLGAKKRLYLPNMNSTPYYFVGVRAEYNVTNNTEEIQTRFSSSAASLFYPFPIYVNKLVYGLSFGGGFEFAGSEYIAPGIEISISPDIGFQYMSPEIPNVTNPFDGRSTTLQERSIRNITLEVSFVLRLKREVVLLDR